MGKKSKRRTRRPTATPTPPRPSQQGATAPTEEETNRRTTNNNNDGLWKRPILDRMMQDFRLASLLYEHDPWNNERLSSFFAYSALWESQTGDIAKKKDEDPKVLSLGATDLDRKFVRKVRRPRTQPPILRAQALYLSGFMILRSQHERHLLDDAQDFFDQAMEVCRSISEEDKQRTIVIVGTPAKVSEVISLLQNKCQIFEHLNSTYYFGAWSPLTGEDIQARIVGGLACDYCQKERKELGLDKLQVCSRCNMAYYCSRECQAKAWWDGGHKTLCRKPGEFKPGDCAYVTEKVELLRIEKDLSKMEWHVDEDGQEFCTLEVIKIIHPGELVSIAQQLESGKFHIKDRDEPNGAAFVEGKSLGRCRPDHWFRFTEEDVKNLFELVIARDKKGQSSDLVDSENELRLEVPPELTSRRPTKEEEMDDD